MRVVSYDPGGVTGVAVWDGESFRAFEIPDGFDGFANCEDRYPLVDADVVTFETFRIRHNTHKLDPVAFQDTTSIIGVVRYMTGIAGGECYGQSPAEAKSFATNDKLRTAGFWTPTTGGHSNDAARHLLVRCMKLRIPEIMERFL